jgi:hypothetical protein
MMARRADASHLTAGMGMWVLCVLLVPHLHTEAGHKEDIKATQDLPLLGGRVQVHSVHGQADTAEQIHMQVCCDDSAQYQ